MGRMLGALAAALVAVLAVAVGTVVATVATVWALYDSNDVKTFAAQSIGTAIGRKFEIKGDAGIDFGWVTRIHLEDVVLANAAWGKEANMVSIGTLDLAIDVRRLLRGDMILPEVGIGAARVLLEKNAAGEPNWRLSTGAQMAAEAAAPETRSEIPVIEKLVLVDGRIRYRDAKSGRSFDLELAELGINDDRTDARVQVRGDGTFQKGPFRLRFVGGSWALLQAGQEPYPIDVDATIGDLKVKAVGTVVGPAQATGIALKVDVQGDDMANLFPISGIALPPSPPYSFSGQIDRHGDEWRFANAVGRVGDSDMRGTFAVVTGGERLRLKADVTSNKLDFKDLGPFIGAKPGGREGQRVATEDVVERRGGRVLPDKPIDLGRLNAMDAEVAFAAKRIEAPDLPIDRLQVKLSLEAGTLRIQPAEFAISDGKVRAFVSLYGAQKPVRVDIDTRIERVDLKDFLRGSEFAKQTAGRLGGRVALQATGTSVAQILGSATGDLFLVLSDGTVSHLLVELAGLDIAESLGIVIGGDKPIPIRCIVADFAAEQGVFTSRTLVVDTTDTNIGGRGTIDMRQEKVNVTLYPLSKDFSPLSIRAPISIQGTFAEPSAFPDPIEMGVDTTVKKIVNAILTPVLGLLPPIDAGVGENSDCAALVERARIGL